MTRHRRFSVPEALAIAVQNLRGNVLRTLLSTLGVIIGVASLVAILALGDGLERYSRAQIAATTDLQTLTLRPRTEIVKDGIRLRAERPPRLTEDDLASLESQLGSRADIAPFIQGSGWAAPRDGVAQRPVLFGATTATAERLLPAPLVAGRYLSEADVETDAAVAIVPETVASWYGLPAAQLPGRTIDLDGRTYRIIGVERASGRAPVRLQIPLGRAARTRLEVGDRALGVAIRVRRVEDVDPLSSELQRWAAARHQSADRFEIVNNRFRAAQARQGMLVFKLVMGSIAGISLLVGGIGIMNILLASVFERTREIGVRRAAGARRSDILMQFLAEAIAISATGSILGVVVGLAGAFTITAAIRHFTEAPVHAAFTWPSVAVAAAAALLVGIAFGTYPARRAAALSPIDAIRLE